MHPTWVVRAPYETNLEIELRTGALLQVLGAEDPDSLRGRGPGFVVLDAYADMAPETWTEVIRPSLMDTQGGALFVGTPKAYNHFHMLYEFGQGHHPDWRSWQFRTLDNPHLDPAEIEHARQTTDARTFRQEYEASFEALAGRVYYAFDRTRHVAPIALERVVPVAVSFDFNIEPATAVIAQRIGEEVHVWREVNVHHAGGEATRACGVRVKQLLDEAGWTGLVRIYGDPAGRAAKTTGPLTSAN